MDKAKRYLGLAVAVALLVFALFPVGNPTYGMAGAKTTPLDDTVLSHVAKVGGGSSNLRVVFLEKMEACNGQQTHNIGRQSCRPGDVYRIANYYADTLAATTPNFGELLKEYSVAKAADVQRTAPSATGVGEPEVIPGARLVKAEDKLAVAILEHLQAEASSLAIPVYLVHGLALGLFLLLVIFRGGVGGLLLLPFSFLFGASKAGGKTAEALHEKG